MRWTQNDEQNFQRLQKRRVTHRSESKGALMDVIRRAFPGAPEEVEAIFDDMVPLADEFRDALKPFDSGVRGKAQEPTS